MFQGRWILLGDQIWWENIPETLAAAINKFLSWNDRIQCVSFNDLGEWMIVSDKHFEGSSKALTDDLITCNQKYGYIRTVSMTNSGYIIVAHEGFLKGGYVPEVVWNQISTNLGFEIKFARFTQNGSYLFSDGSSAYSGYLY